MAGEFTCIDIGNAAGTPYCPQTKQPCLPPAGNAGRFSNSQTGRANPRQKLAADRVTNQARVFSASDADSRSPLPLISSEGFAHAREQMFLGRCRRALRQPAESQQFEIAVVDVRYRYLVTLIRRISQRLDSATPAGSLEIWTPSVSKSRFKKKARGIAPTNASLAAAAASHKHPHDFSSSLFPKA